ncbi:MAG: STAS/SEC14 domain-containing protein [Flavobacteriales bacterium]|nr:STAS/SEC14 domain-containing protein [Flavobacteriales bacterium]MBP7450976.1 STAS/SEC14 domain-containing protein [Flavobacteriales bacterium]
MPVHSIDTELATVERGETDLIHIRVRPGAKLTVNGFAEILAARKALARDKPAGVIAIIPDDIDFELAIMNVDHHAGTNASTFTKVFAIVTQANLHKQLCALYSAFFTTDFPLRTFDDEAVARAWVLEHLVPGSH